MTYSLDDLPIFVISLKHLKGRRDLISKQMAKLGLKFTFVDATYGHLPLSDEDLEIIGRDSEQEYKQHLLPFALGCLISHIKTLKMILQTSAPQGLVLEDDAILLDDFVPALKNIITNNQLKFDYNLLQLGWTVDGGMPFIFKQSYPMNIFFRKKLKGQHKMTQDYLMGPPVTFLNGTEAYLINRQGCEFILKNYQKIICPYDDLLNLINLPKRHLIHPFIVHQGMHTVGVWEYQDDKKTYQEIPEKTGRVLSLPFSIYRNISSILRSPFFKSLIMTFAVMILTKPIGYYKFLLYRKLKRK